MPEENEFGKPLTKKEKAAMKRAAEKAVEAVVATEGERMTAEVPVFFSLGLAVLFLCSF